VSGGRSTDSEIIANNVENSGIQIYAVNGRLVKTLQWIGEFTNSDLPSLKNAHSDLPTGIYFVLASNKTGRDNYKLFIQ